MAGKGVVPPYTHDLILLLEKILPLDSSIDDLRGSLSLLMPYSIEIRYPDDWFMPSPDDTNQALEAAMAVQTWLKSSFKEIF